MTQPSSFQRKVKPKGEPIPGCFPSLYTHHLLASTGIPDLDTLLGGGLPIGTLLLVEEDYRGSYAKLILKYFLAEGVYHRHGIHLSSLTQDPDSIIHNLPGFSENEQNKQEEKKEDEKMTIAWRYQNKPTESSSTNEAKHSFNLLVPIPKDTLNQCDIASCDLSEPSVPELKSVGLLRNLHDYCRDKGFLIQGPPQEGKKNIVRIGVHSLADILWEESVTQVLRFLLALKSLLRSCYGIAIVTVPPTLYQNNVDIRNSIEDVSDYVISLKSFDAEDTVNPAYKDYHGIISVEKIGSIGVLTPPPHLLKDDNELVFKSRRNRFLIEKFHLPPDLSEVVSRDQKDPKLKKNIDF